MAKCADNLMTFVRQALLPLYLFILHTGAHVAMQPAGSVQFSSIQCNASCLLLLHLAVLFDVYDEIRLYAGAA